MQALGASMHLSPSATAIAAVAVNSPALNSPNVQDRLTQEPDGRQRIPGRRGRLRQSRQAQPPP